MRRGYAGKTQTGVIVCMGKIKVDQRMRYTPLLAHIAMTTHIQNTTTIVCRSQGPVCGMPYWQMLIHIVPNLRARSARAFCYTQGYTEHIRDDLASLLVEIYIHHEEGFFFFFERKA